MYFESVYIHPTAKQRSNYVNRSNYVGKQICQPVWTQQCWTNSLNNRSLYAVLLFWFLQDKNKGNVGEGGHRIARWRETDGVNDNRIEL